MANILISPRDPLFWSHHAQVDYLWDRWQRSHTFEGPPDLSVPLNIGGGRVISVREVLRIDSLDYEYAIVTIALTPESRAAIPDSTGTQRLVLAYAPNLDHFREAELRLEGIPLPSHYPYEIRVFLGLPDATAETPTDDNPHFVGYFDAVMMGHESGHGRSHAMADTMQVSFEVTKPLRSALASVTGSEDKVSTTTPVVTLVPVGDAREFRFERALIVLQD